MLEVKKKSQSTLQRFECEMHPVPPGTKRRGPRPLRGSEWDLPPILVEIVTTGLRRIQEMGPTGDAQRCAIEAEHVQHLPALLYEFDPEVLEKYWTIERAAFIQQSSNEDVKAFEPLWAALAEVLQQRKDEVATGRG
jgi:hypothetical protein